MIENDTENQISENATKNQFVQEDLSSQEITSSKTSMSTMAVRLCMAAGVAGTFIYLTCTQANLVYFLPALTYQGMVLLAIYSISQLIKGFLPANKGIQLLTLVLRNISFPIAVFISLLSWSLKIPVNYEEGLWTFKNHFYHTLNSTACLIYMVLDPEPWFFSHCYQPLLYGLAYVAFSGIIQATGHPPQYPFLDFKNNPDIAAVVVVGSAALIPLIHVIMTALSKVPQCRKDKCCSAKQQ